jgi:hypothetical protein
VTVFIPQVLRGLLARANIYFYNLSLT